MELSVVPAADKTLYKLLESYTTRPKGEGTYISLSELTGSLQSVDVHQRYSILESMLDGRTILHRAAKDGHKGVIRCIFDNITVEERYSLLRIQTAQALPHVFRVVGHIANESSSADTVKYILDSITPKSTHSLLMVQDVNKDTPLHKTSKSGSADTVKYCNGQTIKDLSPLHLCVFAYYISR